MDLQSNRICLIFYKIIFASGCKNYTHLFVYEIFKTKNLKHFLFPPVKHLLTTNCSLTFITVTKT